MSIIVKTRALHAQDMGTYDNFEEMKAVFRPLLDVIPYIMPKKAREVFRNLFELAGKNKGVAYPTYQRLAELSGCARSTAIEWVNALKEAQIVKVKNDVRRYNEQASNYFIFTKEFDLQEAINILCEKTKNKNLFMFSMNAVDNEQESSESGEGENHHPTLKTTLETTLETTLGTSDEPSADAGLEAVSSSYSFLPALPSFDLKREEDQYNKSSLHNTTPAFSEMEQSLFERATRFGLTDEFTKAAILELRNIPHNLSHACNVFKNIAQCPPIIRTTLKKYLAGCMENKSWTPKEIVRPKTAPISSRVQEIEFPFYNWLDGEGEAARAKIDSPSSPSVVREEYRVISSYNMNFELAKDIVITCDNRGMQPEGKYSYEQYKQALIAYESFTTPGDDSDLPF